MTMIPASITRQLCRLRRRERIFDLIWGGARWLTVVIALFLIAAFIDWAVDREQDTPKALRNFLSYLQIAVAGGAFFWFVLVPLARRRPDADLALCVEDKHAALHHRLISAVQLNRPDADTEGMSRELIGVVTGEAVQAARTMDFARVADPTRPKHGLALLLVAFALFAMPYLLWPETAEALLARQFGDDRDIPRRISIVPISAEVWPSGEKVLLRFRVKGPDLDRSSGVALLRAAGQAGERFALELDKTYKVGDDESVASALIPPSSFDFTYDAFFGDGRTKKPGRIHYVPRPVITQQTAWAVLPEFCGVRADGSRYEVVQSRGDILGIAGSSAKVVIKTQKPIREGYLELLGPEKIETAESPGDAGPEVLKRTVPLHGDAPDTWQATFDLRPEETGYRIIVKDEHGFENIPPPRRTVRMVPEEPPQVSLLKEQFPPTLQAFLTTNADDFVVEGLPLPQGGSIPIAYTASGPYGLGQARLLFRVLKKVESGNDEQPEEKWLVLPLQEVAGSEKSGPFDPRIGAFENSGAKDQIFFHAVPDGNPLPRTLGGGRFDFKTTGIPDGKGGLVTLKIGDQIEYCIEIFADKNAKTDRPSARSETRVKTVVSFSDLERWLTDNLQEAQRIRSLDRKQRGLFDEP